MTSLSRDSSFATDIALSRKSDAQSNVRQRTLSTTGLYEALLSPLAFLGITFDAVAADLPRRVAAPSVPAPAVINWSGFYVGAHVGYGWADFEFQDPSVTVATPGL